MRSRDEVENALRRLAQGATVSAVARETGIPRGTLNDWARGQIPGAKQRSADCPVCNDAVLPEAAYAYLLGTYLGDGCISPDPRTYRLRVFMDAKYPKIILRNCAAMRAICPSKVPHLLHHGSENCITISMHWNHWPCIFPQHGPGRKHDREIALAAWQEELVKREPEQLLRGLIESDGCRIVANDRGRASVRYHFSNKSEDIKRIYCDALDRLEIPWTRPCSRQIAVYRKAAAARMDEFIGPKS